MSEKSANNPLVPSSDPDEKDVVFGRTVVPVPLHNKPMKKDMLGFEYAEHSFIGDAIYLTMDSGKKVPAVDHKFTLANRLVVTYGQINGLAGDFYGTSQPISDGKDGQEQAARFRAAFNTLAGANPRQPEEAQKILAILQTEVDAVNDALRRHEDPSVAYSKLPDVTAALEAATITRPISMPGYMGLARINWDHFGPDARTTYNAGHALALLAASTGDLAAGYTLNAFADHFLEDSFSSGHLRTPRRALHGTVNFTADLCAKYMHDEDCAIGLSVKNPAGESWTCYGDKRALDAVDADNLKRCVAAVQASADEIYAAYTSRQVPPPESYKAWTLAPTLASALGEQVLTPLFKHNDKDPSQIYRRRVIEKRRLHEFTQSWWYATTATECAISGLWKYPITLDTLDVVPWTNIAAAAPKLWYMRVLYQSPTGGIWERVCDNGGWSGSGDPLLQAPPFTPLAALSWDDGRTNRVYYLNSDHVLQEGWWANGRWVTGGLNGMNFKASPNTCIGAFYYYERDDRRIRLYCQEDGSNNIKEICFDTKSEHWYRGATLPSALSGTSIAAIFVSGIGFRIYYQTEDLSIREHCLDASGWFQGGFNGGKAPGHTPIGAVHSGGLNVYWVDAESTIVSCRVVQGGELPRRVVGPVLPGSRFAVAHWNSGKNIRIYYQGINNSIREICKDGDGSWFDGETVAGPA